MQGKTDRIKPKVACAGSVLPGALRPDHWDSVRPNIPASARQKTDLTIPKPLAIMYLLSADKPPFRKSTARLLLLSSVEGVDLHLQRRARSGCRSGQAFRVSPRLIKAGNVAMPTVSPRSEESTSRSEFGSGSKTNESPHIPQLTLDKSGTIQDLNEPGRRALEYSADASVNSCFFSHVHGRNLRRVMRDLALMVSHRKQRTRWLLRLRTGSGRWRWYRLAARNHLDEHDGTIRIRLRPL
jgi:PAS domain-containing protein